MRDVHRQLSGRLPTCAGEDSWTLPTPNRHVLGQNGVIAYTAVDPDYTKVAEGRRPGPHS